MRLLTLTCLALLLTGCLPSHGGKDSLSLWRHRDQFARLEAPGGGASDHPVTLQQAQVRRALAALRVCPEGSSVAPLFADNELDVLSDAVARGLSAAEPQQDLTFAVVGMHRGSFVLERRLTSGRFFYRDGDLNLLLGAVHAPYDESEDRRLHPFSNGSRTAPAPVTLTIEERNGLAFAGDAVAPRRDWLRLDLDTLGAESAEEEGTGHSPDGDVAALRAEVRQLRDSIAPPAASFPLPPAGGEPVAERLRLLQQLHAEGLIDDKDYAQKKQQILDSI